jgi:hydroxypyruvate isomerase
VKFSAHLSTLFPRLPLLERPAAARAAGFEYVESWWPGAAALAFASEIARCSLQLILVNAYCGDIPAGERGFANLPEHRTRVLTDIAKAVALRPSRVNVLVGIGGGREQVVDVLQQAAELTTGTILTVEHLNNHDVPGYLLPTPQAAAELVRDVGAPSIRLLYDSYHAAMAGLDPSEDVLAYEGLVGHAQYAEAPGRGEPSDEIWRFVESLETIGYAGPLGLEHTPGTTVRLPE